jgi:hypothetical protein
MPAKVFPPHARRSGWQEVVTLGVELYATTLKWPPKDATPRFGAACSEQPIEAMLADAPAHR